MEAAVGLPLPAAVPVGDFVNLPPPPTDMIGPSDVLEIDVYEAGVTLFGGSGGGKRISGESSTFDPSVQVEKIGPIRVSDDGNIRLPYIGQIHVAGRTVAELESIIRRSLRKLSQSPQVLVSIREGITNSIIMAGEVTRPGRLVLTTNRETLADAVALAGGYRGEAKDLTLRLQRGSRNAEFRLSEVINGAYRDLVAYPGDRISLIRAPRTFSVFGASNRVEQLTFNAPVLSLAEAVAQAGGANPALGDPRAIFVFRYAPNADGKDQPTIYHLNLMRTGGYFLAQRFMMTDKDVLYVGNAAANQPSKMVQLISQLFSPLVVITSAAQTLKN